jgi:hypothetical protein
MKLKIGIRRAGEKSSLTVSNWHPDSEKPVTAWKQMYLLLYSYKKSTKYVA